MKISEYIAALESIRSQHGDIEVQKSGTLGDRETAPEPKLAHALTLKGRETKPRFWCGGKDESRKGEPVCRV